MNTHDSTPQRQITKNQYLIASESRRILVRLLSEGKSLNSFAVRWQTEYLATLPIELLRHLEEIYPAEVVK